MARAQGARALMALAFETTYGTPPASGYTRIRNDGRIDGADPSIAALTGRTQVRFADQTLVTQAINGEACELEFA